MPITRRKIIPDPVVSHVEREEVRGRNQALQGLRLDVYQYIEGHPGCTRREVASALRLSSSTATARIKELIDEGLVYEPIDRKRNVTGVRVKTLKVAPENYTGHMRDRVRVQLSIRVDLDGNYYANARVVDGLQLAESHGPLSKVLQKEITVMVPKPSEVKPVFETLNVTKMGTAEVRSSKDLIIDADFSIIEGEPPSN